MNNRTASSEWEGQLGEKWAKEWRRTDRSFGMLTERLLQRSREFSFDSLLDIGCGAGELSLAIARGRPRVEVTGVDISTDLVRAASDRSRNLNNVHFELADASGWTPDPGKRPDLVVSRHGVMFFDDPPAAFRHIAKISADGASLMFSCFRDRRENDWVNDLARMLPDGGLSAAPVDPYAPGPFAFGDRDYVRGILEAGGWSQIAFEAFDFGMVAGAGEDAAADATSYFLSIGPAAAAARDLDEEERTRFAGNIHSMLRGREVDGLVVLRAAAWIVTARKG